MAKDVAAARSRYLKGALQGWGVPLNYAQALRWHEKAAAEGNEVAKKNIARLTSPAGRH